MSTSKRSGADVLLEVLRSEGVTHIFGNPGTTELPLIDALVGAPDIQYILSLQEAVVIGMADGYAQYTRRPAFVNVHSAAGLGNALGNLTNTLSNRTPMVVTAGQQDYRHLFREPLLGWDLVKLAEGAVKTSFEIRTLGELGTLMRRAFHIAMSPPTGPVFVSLPSHILMEEGEGIAPPPSDNRLRPVASSLSELAGLLCEAPADQLAFVAGDEVVASGAVEELVQVAEQLGAVVFGSPMHSNLVFPPYHPLWRGSLSFTASDVRERLGAFKRVFLVGGQAFMSYLYTDGPALPEETELLHLSPDVTQLGRTYATRLGLWGDPKVTLEALLPLLRQMLEGNAPRYDALQSEEARLHAVQEQQTQVAALAGQSPIHPLVAVHTVLSQVPSETIIVDESISNNVLVRSCLHLVKNGQYYFTRGGGLGWGMPAALGVSLASKRRPVICFIGDGSTMYAPQALWNAAHDQLPVLFIVLNNRGYSILKHTLSRMGGQSVTARKMIGLDLNEPAIDFVALAHSMGVDAITVRGVEDLNEQVQLALREGKPYLIDVQLSS